MVAVVAPLVAPTLNLQDITDIDVHLLFLVALPLVQVWTLVVATDIPHDDLIQLGQVDVLAGVGMHTHRHLPGVLGLGRLAQFLNFLVLVAVRVVGFWQTIRQVVQILVCSYCLQQLFVNLRRVAI